MSAGLVNISIHADVKHLQRSLDDLSRKQLPFATTLALTGLAKRVQAEETKALGETFDKPSPFTLRAFGVKAAKKSTLTALVFAKDIQAEYLKPFLDGGRQLLRGKRGLPVPVDIRTNQYGNLPKGTIARLKAQPNVFFGAVKLKDGRVISGIWQRPAVGTRRDGTRGSKGNTQRRVGGARTGLKLLVKWSEGVELHQRLGYRERASRIINGFFGVEFSKAMAKAMATAR
ncbi:hypothetical protein [Telmatospirillum sp.]|uniref:hypothetical protein n=1 Tax=Telmatospirillum sp. TaxID=2079197 RepID=UPI00284CFFCA|nr:hypothetical protein [Telmatospirillum sp.]MDR3438964.1 hypothetical protein [Telmatospirillum sp.]